MVTGNTNLMSGLENGCHWPGMMERWNRMKSLLLWQKQLSRHVNSGSFRMTVIWLTSFAAHGNNLTVASPSLFFCDRDPQNAGELLSNKTVVKVGCWGMLILAKA